MEAVLIGCGCGMLVLPELGGIVYLQNEGMSAIEDVWLTISNLEEEDKP